MSTSVNSMCFRETSAVLITILHLWLLLLCTVFKATKQFLIKVVKSNKGIKLSLTILKSWRELLHFMAIHNILVQFEWSNYSVFSWALWYHHAILIHMLKPFHSLQEQSSSDSQTMPCSQIHSWGINLQLHLWSVKLHVKS